MIGGPLVCVAASRDWTASAASTPLAAGACGQEQAVGARSDVARGLRVCGVFLLACLLSCPPPLPFLCDTQTLDHPSNLWAVAFLPSGDLVTACSDHVARVWTQAEARRGPAELAQVGWCRQAGGQQPAGRQAAGRSVTCRDGGRQAGRCWQAGEQAGGHALTLPAEGESGCCWPHMLGGSCQCCCTCYTRPLAD